MLIDRKTTNVEPDAIVRPPSARRAQEMALDGVVVSLKKRLRSVGHIFYFGRYVIETTVERD